MDLELTIQICYNTVIKTNLIEKFEQRFNLKFFLRMMFPIRLNNKLRTHRNKRTTINSYIH